MWADTIQIIKDRITLDVYEPSAAAYQLHWFCILKQDGKSLCLVHSLQPLNAVTIQDLSTPPFVEHLAESFAGYAVYSMMDLFTGYDQCSLHPDSRDLTTFNSPLGPHRLTTIPMEYTNVVQIYQADMSCILQDEIPCYSYPFIDDLPVKSVTTRYENLDGSYKTIPDNPGIRCFIWEHLQVVHRILQRPKNIGATVSAKNFILATPDATIVSHKCTFKGRIPHEAKVQKIRDWPECQSLTQVRGFLGVCGVLRIFIHDFTSLAHPLVHLTKKGVTFNWGEPQQNAMQCLKDAICQSPVLCQLDYESSREVILAIDTSLIMVGYILLQEGDDGKRYPNRFGSIGLSDVESRHSQAKLELYRLFRALQAVRIFIFGVNNFTVEMDAKYVQGMINNPDLQPNVTINRWIAGILLFSFCLIHVLAAHHTGADVLSRCLPSDEDPPDKDDFEDWLDNSYSFSITLLNGRIAPYGGFAHLSRLPSGPLLESCPMQLAPYDDTLPTHLDVSCVAPVLIITDSDFHHDDPIIPCTAKAHAKDDRIDQICNFLRNHVRPPDLSDSDYTSFVNVATRFFLLNRSLYHQEQHR